MPSKFIDIEWTGLDEYADALGNFSEALIDVLIAEYTRFGLLLEGGTKKLAPEDDGDLAASINMQIKRIGNAGVEMTVGTNLIYALRRHEEPYRSGRFPKYSRGAKFPDYYVNGRGAETRTKSWRGFPAGRKYLSNAVKATEADYQEMLLRVLEQAKKQSGF